MLEYKYADRRKYTITSCNISIRIAGKSSLDENDKSIDSNNHQWAEYNTININDKKKGVNSNWLLVTA